MERERENRERKKRKEGREGEREEGRKVEGKETEDISFVFLYNQHFMVPVQALCWV
jgi:hypothetical protein